MHSIFAYLSLTYMACLIDHFSIVLWHRFWSWCNSNKWYPCMNASWKITAKNVDFKASSELFANYCWKLILLMHFIYKSKRFYLQCIQSCQKSACWPCCWNSLFYPRSYLMIMKPGFELNNSTLELKERSRYMK